jgi:hypothetical protein
MPDAGASRKRQISVRRIPGDLTAPEPELGLSELSLYVAAAAWAAQMWRRFGGARSIGKRLGSENKEFCTRPAPHEIELRESGVASAGSNAKAKVPFADRSEDISARIARFRSFDSARVTPGAGKTGARLPARRPASKMDMVWNVFSKQ